LAPANTPRAEQVAALRVYRKTADDLVAACADR
jgi:hypothetical protein